jgi:hypothetical protein
MMIAICSWITAAAALTAQLIPFHTGSRMLCHSHMPAAASPCHAETSAPMTGFSTLFHAHIPASAMPCHAETRAGHAFVTMKSTVALNAT